MDVTRYLRDLVKIAQAENDLAFQRAIQACEYNPKLIPKIEMILSAEAWAKDNRMEPDPFPPPADEIPGDVEIGIVLQTGKRVGLSVRELLQGTLICGRSGAGKTNLAFYIVEQLCKVK
jgi:hypothetical protein